jgi:hypothetical protein
MIFVPSHEDDVGGGDLAQGKKAHQKCGVE